MERYDLEDNPGWLVIHKAGAPNGDEGDSGLIDSGEYWVVTTPDGVKYVFGKGIEPNSGTATNSVQTVPVYGNAGSPCNGKPGSWCDQAYRWNLDGVIDTRGNFQTIFYAKETNSYGFKGDENTIVSYVRYAYPTSIEYSQVNGTDAPPTKVFFQYTQRCTEQMEQPPVACTTDSGTSASSWPDAPYDLKCDAAPCTTTSPTFWTLMRLSSIETWTFQWSGTTTPHTAGTWRAVDLYQLTHSYSTDTYAGFTTKPKLWFSTVTRTGDPDLPKPGGGTYTGGSTTAMPPVFSSDPTTWRTAQTTAPASHHWRCLACSTSTTNSGPRPRSPTPDPTPVTEGQTQSAAATRRMLPTAGRTITSTASQCTTADRVNSSSTTSTSPQQ